MEGTGKATELWWPTYRNSFTCLIGERGNSVNFCTILIQYSHIVILLTSLSGLRFNKNITSLQFDWLWFNQTGKSVVDFYVAYTNSMNELLCFLLPSKGCMMWEVSIILSFLLTGKGVTSIGYSVSAIRAGVGIIKKANESKQALLESICH